MTRQFLRGHRVTVIPTIQDAVAALSSSQFDLILSDFDLDDGKGDEFVCKCRTRFPHVPIVAVSAHDTGNTALLKAGASAVCGKMEFDRIEQVISMLREKV